MINSLLGSDGYCPSLIQPEDMFALLSNASNVTSQDLLRQICRGRIHKHLRFSLCVTPNNTSMFRNNPQILRMCSVHCFDSWPVSALKTIARASLEEISEHILQSAPENHSPKKLHTRSTSLPMELESESLQNSTPEKVPAPPRVLKKNRTDTDTTAPSKEGQHEA